MIQKFPDTDNNLTKPYLAKFLVDRLVTQCKEDNPDLRNVTFLEPGAGELAPFTQAANAHNRDFCKELWVGATSMEYRNIVDDTIVPNVDFLNPEDDSKWRDYDSYRIIATNPPFSKGKAIAFIRRGLELLHGRGYMGLLLGLNFLASEERRLLYQEYPPHEVVVIQDRPSFIRPFDGKKGTDLREYCFIIWQGVAVKPEQTILNWTDIRDPDKKPKARATI